MTVVDVLGRGDELADGTGGTADAVRGDGNRSISEIPVQDAEALSASESVEFDIPQTLQLLADVTVQHLEERVEHQNPSARRAEEACG